VRAGRENLRQTVLKAVRKGKNWAFMGGRVTKKRKGMWEG